MINIKFDQARQINIKFFNGNMSSSNKKVILITYLGIIPFYISPLAKYYDYGTFLSNFMVVEKISFTYASLIISFLSGMQWQKMIINRKNNLLVIPLIPLLLVLTHNNVYFRYYDYFIIFISLFLSLFIDLKVLKNSLEPWFKKLRINATILASLSLLL